MYTSCHKRIHLSFTVLLPILYIGGSPGVSEALIAEKGSSSQKQDEGRKPESARLHR